MSLPRFPNRIAALAFVGLTLAAVAALVGTDENEGALSNAAQALAEKADQASATGSQAPVPPVAPPQPTPPQSAKAATQPAPTIISEFAEDESLIDDASGFDPSPISEDPGAGEVVVIVEKPAPAVETAPAVIEEP